VADVHHISRFGGDTGEYAVGGRFHFEDRFVGFHFEQHLALADRLALLLQPRNELAGFLRHLERRHDNADRHRAETFP
jgi:hypothetical protein